MCANAPAEVFSRLNAHTMPVGGCRLFGTACVLGGGVAGLVAARVLADHADRVLVVEPDGPGVDRAARPGVPQGYQVHVLLPGGRAQLERFFPGIVAQAVGEGAALHPPDLVASYLDEVEQITTPNAEFVASSRPFLEAVIRRRVLALPNVEFVTGRTTGLRFTQAAVDAVRYTSGDGEVVVQDADFVVDASGRSSRLSDWLAREGWPRPEMERLQVDVRYTSARFTRSEHWSGPYTSISRYSPSFDSGGLAVAAVSAIEDRQWTIMLAHFGSPADDFVARCRELPPIYREAVRGEPLGAVVPYRHPDSRWRHFEALARFPARLAVVGDAVASFNPVYGQGMTSAALHASCLSEYLRSGPDLGAPAREFLALQHVLVDAAWRISTAGDAARLGVATPPATDVERRQAWAMGQIRAAAVLDVHVGTAFRAVSFMTAHPASLFEPELVRHAARVNGVAEEEIRRVYG